MAQYLNLPNGYSIEIQAGESPQQALARMQKKYPEILAEPKPKDPPHMTKYLTLPDGSSVEVPDKMTYDEAMAKARQQYPDAFTAKEAPGTGLSSLMSKTQLPQALHIDLGNASIIAIGAAIIGATVTYTIYKISKNILLSKNKKLFFFLIISIFIGSTGIANELISNKFFNSALNINTIWKYILANFVAIPIIILVAIYIIGFKNKISNNKYTKNNELYAIAIDEIENDRKDKGLWARCFAESNGNKDAAIAAYLKARVTMLRN